MVTENSDVQSMEAVLSGEQANASDAAIDTITEGLKEMGNDKVEDDTPAPEDEKETPAPEDNKDQKQEEKKYTYSEFRSAVDKEKNTAREVHEKDAELIRTLKSEKKSVQEELRKLKGNGELDELYKADLDDGTDETRAKRIDTLRKQFKEQYDTFINQKDDAQEYFELAETITKNMNQEYVKAFGLNDPNPYARAANTLNIINETIGLHEANTLYKDVLEVLVEKGSELRKEVDSLVAELQGKSKGEQKLLIEKRKDELKITPRKAPSKPTSPTVEDDDSHKSPLQKIHEGLEEKRKISNRR